jgi:hypothetical protein
MTDFKAYHAALKDREPRPFFLEALSYIEVPKAEPKAIDLGFGDGAETRHLLSLGWRVTAIDKEASSIRNLLLILEPEVRKYLSVQVSSFEKVSLPSAHFIYAGLSLPYVMAGNFQDVWQKIEDSLEPEGYFAGHFFGVRNETNNEAMTSHSKEAVKLLFKDFELLILRELEEDAKTALGVLRHWHYFEVIAKKKASMA